MPRLPKEHGAWVMLYVPFLLGALVAGTWRWGTLLLWIAVTAIFIGRDALVNWGRARRRGRVAPEGRFAVAYFAVALASGAAVLVIDRLHALLAGGIAAALLLWWHFARSVERRERSTAGELWMIAGLTLTAPAAYHVGSGRLDATALWLWCLCILYFTSSVFHVRLRVLALQPRREAERLRVRRGSLAYHCCLALLLLGLAGGGILHPLVVVAYVPILARSARHLAPPRREADMKQVGILEMVYSAGFLVCMTIAFRQGA